jgi:hypothetical protein
MCQWPEQNVSIQLTQAGCWERDALICYECGVITYKQHCIFAKQHCREKLTLKTGERKIYVKLAIVNANNSS